VGKATVWSKQEIKKAARAITPLAQSQPLNVTITKTADGQAEYMQIFSADQFSVNIVLISPKITVRDTR
jgi:hypothetical protein